MGDKNYYIFTFGSGQLHEGKYVKIFGDYDSARKLMFERYGDNWAFQYSSKEWGDWLREKPFYVPNEIELETLWC